MIKMTSDRPLLINGEARTEFETDEQHAKELELKGLASRVKVEEADAAPSSTASAQATDTTAAPAPAPAPTARRASSRAT